MSCLRRFDRWTRFACTTLGVFGAAAIVFIQILVTADVILRDTITKPIIGSFELVEYAMVVAVFSAFGITQVNRFHISVDVVVSRLPKRLRAALDALTLLIMFIFFAAAIWIGYDQTLKIAARGAYSQVLLIDRWPFQAMVVIGFASFCLAIARDFVFAVVRAFGKEIYPESAKRDEPKTI